MNRSVSFRMRFLTALSPVLAMLALAACGGGASTTENPPTTPPPAAGYTGPPPASQDVQAFKLNVWDNLQASNRCGQCHGTGGQVPSFVRSDDINLAYEAANSVVDLGNPSASMMVTKVGGGHNCWLAADSACADQLTVWIRNWAGQTMGGTRGAPLQPPPIKDVGASKSFPASSALFGSTVYPVLTQYCSRCHSSGATTPQSPFFAEANVDVAYAAVRAKINLDSPDQSRLVVRLRDEFHNCWTDCATAANVMLGAIQDFADGVPLTQVDPNLVTSKALTLYDGTVASGGNRFDNAAIALYEFKTGTGTVAYDTSRRRTVGQPDDVGRRDLGRRLGHRPARRQGAGDDRLEPQAPRPHQGDGRILDRGLGRAGQRGAGAGVHRELLRRHDGPELHARPDDVQLRLLQPRDDDRRERRARALDAVGGRGAAGDAAARGRDLQPGRRPPHLRERRAHDAGRPGPGRPLHRLERHLRARARQRGLATTAPGRASCAWS